MLNTFFDENKWSEVASSRHDWYRVIYPEFEAILLKYENGDQSRRKVARDSVYGYFENLSSQIAEKVIASKNTRNPSWLANILRPTIAIPFAFASIIVIACIIYFNQNKNSQFPEQEFTSDDLNESNYLLNIDESVFVDLISFENTNIKTDSMEEYLMDNEIDVAQLENEL